MTQIKKGGPLAASGWYGFRPLSEAGEGMP
jgi:hypothetical protein